MQIFLQVQVEGLLLVIPSSQVITLRRIMPGDRQLCYGSILVPVRPLAELFGLANNTAASHALLVSEMGRWQGLAVDEVQQLHEIKSEEIRPLPPLLTKRHHNNLIDGVVLLNGQPLLVLDLKTILSV